MQANTNQVTEEKPAVRRVSQSGRTIPRTAFVKGQSGNPLGGPKKTQQDIDLIAACREKSVEALGTILEIMRNGNEKNRLAAANIIIERGFGKAVQPVQANTDLDVSIAISFVPKVAKTIDHE